MSVGAVTGSEVEEELLSGYLPGHVLASFDQGSNGSEHSDGVAKCGCIRRNGLGKSHSQDNCMKLGTEEQ